MRVFLFFIIKAPFPHCTRKGAHTFVDTSCRNPQPLVQAYPYRYSDLASRFLPPSRSPSGVRQILHLTATVSWGIFTPLPCYGYHIELSTYYAQNIELSRGNNGISNEL